MSATSIWYRDVASTPRITDAGLRFQKAHPPSASCRYPVVSSSLRLTVSSHDYPRDVWFPSEGQDKGCCSSQRYQMTR